MLLKLASIWVEGVDLWTMWTMLGNQGTVPKCFNTRCHIVYIKVGAPGMATRSKDATKDSWPYY